MPTRELPLHQDSLRDLFLIVYVQVDDYCKALIASGTCTLPSEPHQKASYSELMTIALVGDLLSQPYQSRWYALVRREYRDVFPVLPDVTRYHRIQLNLERVYADFALRMPHFDHATVYTVDSKPLVLCQGGRFKRPRASSEASSGDGGSRGTGRKCFFYGFKRHAVVDDHGHIVRFAIVTASVGDPTVARCLLDPLEASLVLGDRGYQGCGVYAEPTKSMKHPRPWWGAMRWVRTAIEHLFSSLLRTNHLMLPQLNSLRSVRAHVCRKIAAHNLAHFLIP